MRYDWMLLAPVLIPAIGAVALLVLDVIWPRLGRWHWVLAALLLAAGAVAAVPLVLPGAQPAATLCRSGQACLYTIDHVGAGLQIAALASAAVVALLAYPIPVPRRRAPVLAVLVLAAATGAAGVAAAADLGSWLVLVELATLPTVVLVALRARRSAVDGSLSLLMTALVSFGVMAMGAALWYAAARGGLLGGEGLVQAIHDPDDQRVLALAMMFLLAGLAFKLSLVPFHAWTPEAVGGASVPIGAYLVVTSKIAGLAALLVLLRSATHLGNSVLAAVGLLSAVTMTAGNLLALRERATLRFLAWSTVAQAGWVILPLATSAGASRRAAAGYLLVYSLATLVAFAVVTAVAHADGRDRALRLEDFRGLVRRRPVLGTALAMALLVLAGLPPGVTGLVAKVYALAPVAGNHVWLLTVIAAVNAMLGVAVYLRWMRMVLGRARPDERPSGRVHPMHNAVVVVGLAALIATSIAPQLLLGAAG